MGKRRTEKSESGEKIKKIESIVRHTIGTHRLIEKGDHVVVGLSGGPDSVCLFSLLCGFAQAWDLRLYAVHVNHMLRPGAAEADRRYVEALCKKSNVQCDVVVFDCAAIAKKQGITSEEAGRNARYEAFGKTAEKLVRQGAGASKIKIAVAHNKNDQAETVLMRLFRGTGPDGLAGMEYLRREASGFAVVRPLLDAERADILHYCAASGLEPQMDQSNDLPLYTRNKIRLALLPHLAETYNENILDALVRLAQAMREDRACLRELAAEALAALRLDGSQASVPGHHMPLAKGTHDEAAAESLLPDLVQPDYPRPDYPPPDAVWLDRAGLAALAVGIRRRVILAAFSEIGLKQDISAAHLNAAEHIIQKGDASAFVHFPKGYGVSVSYDRVEICHRPEEQAADGGSQALVRGRSASFGEGPVPAGEESIPTISQKVMSKAAFDALAGRESKGGGSRQAALDYAAFAAKLAACGDGLVLRTRRPGDIFSPPGMKSGRKKIQDYFVDEKIPRAHRDRIWLACIGAEVLWIIGSASADFASVGGEINEKYKVGPETKRVVLLEIHRQI